MKLLQPTDANYRSPKRSASSGTQVRPWLLAWLGLPVLGVANGALRDATYKQATGELAAQQLSTATLLGLMTAYIWRLQRRWPIRSSREALTIGGSWALLTILFEFGFGHYVTRDSWAALRGAYNLAEGRVWAAVPVWTAVGPELIRRLNSGR